MCEVIIVMLDYNVFIDHDEIIPTPLSQGIIRSENLELSNGSHEPLMTFGAFEMGLVQTEKCCNRRIHTRLQRFSMKERNKK